MHRKVATAFVGSMLALVAVPVWCARPSGAAPAQTTNAETDVNRAIIKRAFDAWEAGHGEVFGLLAPDATLIIPGTGPSAGMWTSKEAFLTQVARPFLSRFSVAPAVVVYNILAGGDTVIVHFDAHAVGLDGKPYANSYVWLFEMRDKAVTKLTMYYDLAAFDAMKRRVPASAATAGEEYRGPVDQQKIYGEAARDPR